MRTMAAGSFKAECLAVIDEVQAKRETVVITKHGKPAAKLVPPTKIRTRFTTSSTARVAFQVTSFLPPSKTGVASSDSPRHARGCLAGT
jgi:prevent-host-death family protein